MPLDRTCLTKPFEFDRIIDAKTHSEVRYVSTWFERPKQQDDPELIVSSIKLRP